MLKRSKSLTKLAPLIVQSIKSIDGLKVIMFRFN
jgi:hypothetical protein